MRISLIVAAALISAGLVGPAAAEAGDRDGARRGFPGGRNNNPPPQATEPSARSRMREAFSGFNRNSGPSVNRPTITRPNFQAPSITRQSPPQPRNQPSAGLGALRSRFSGGQNGNGGAAFGDVFRRNRSQPSTPQVTLPPQTAAPRLPTATGPAQNPARNRNALDRLRQRFGGTTSNTPQVSGPTSPLLQERISGRRQGTPPSPLVDTGQARRRIPGSTAGGTTSPLVTERSALATERLRDGRSRIFGGTTGSTRGGTIVAPGTSGGSSLLGPRAGIRRYHSGHSSYLHRHYDGGYYFWGGINFGYPYRHHHYYDGCFGPAFGFGLVYYSPIYTPWILPVIESPTVIVVEQEPVYVLEQPAPYYGPPLGPTQDPIAPMPGEVPAPGAFPPPSEEPTAPVAPEEVPGTNDAASNPTFDAGVQAFLAGDYETACARFRDVTASEPEHGEAWLALVQANFALMRYDEAAKALAKAANLGAFPRGYRFDPRPLYAKSEGAFLAAFSRLKERVRKSPEDADARLVLAYLHVSLGESADAHAQINEVLRIRPADETAPILTLALLPPLPPQTTSPGMDGR